MTTLINDIKYGLRQLRKSPGFAGVAVLSLALGIAASATLFGVLKALVLDPFPFPDSERIAYVWSDVGWPLSVPDFQDLRAQNRSFKEIGVFRTERLTLGLESPESVYTIQCTSGVLRALGMPPMLGRWFEEADERPGAEPVAVISHSLWSRSFGANPQILSQLAWLNGQAARIVGVMSSDFEFPSAWRQGRTYELWTPLSLGDQGRSYYYLFGIGRLREGVTLEQANADLQVIGRHLAELYPDTNLNKPFAVRSLHWQMTHTMSSGLRILFGAVALLVLVACANVAGMLLARGTERQSEFGVRLALGAPRWSVVRLVLTETLLLGIAGCCVGVLVSVWGMELFRNLLPAQLVTEARRAAIRTDGTVLLFSSGLALVSALLAGLLPALTAAQIPVQEILQEGGRSRTASRLRSRFLKQLVAAQIALALVLANGALLLSASYLRVLEANHSLNSEAVLAAEITLHGPRYEDQQARLRFWDQLARGIETLPGAQVAGITSKLPLEGGINRTMLVDDEVYDPTVRRVYVEESLVTSDYFSALGIPLLRGRLFQPQDTADKSVGMVINRAMAEKYWPQGDPIGGRIRPNGPFADWNGFVIGVVENTRQLDAEHEPRPEMYFPLGFQAPASAIVVVRATGNASTLAPMIRRQLAALDPHLPLADVRTMRMLLDAANSRRRLSTYLMNAFVLMALGLTVVGVYGTLSYHLAQRRREIGIRMAMGAEPHGILKFALRQAGVWVSAGLGTGLLLAGLSSLVLRSRVYGISPWHPGLLLAGVVLVAGAACMACFVPTIRAMRISPMEVLRHE